MKKIIFSVIGIGLIIILTNSCKHDIPKSTYCFQREIFPIIKSSCAQPLCHNATDTAGGYNLEDYDNIMKKGVVRGNASASLLYTCLSGSAAHPMPTAPYALLDDTLKEMIRTWINEGAMNITGCDVACNSGTTVSFSKDVFPLMKVSCYGCHNTSTYSDYGGGWELSDYNTIYSMVSDPDTTISTMLVKSVNHDPSLSAMPKGLSKLTDCQVNVIKKWVAAGAPNN